MGGWLALAIGNSRLHWATFVDQTLQTVHHTPYLPESAIAQLLRDPWQCHAWSEQVGLSLPEAPAELWVASVVPAQTELWHHSSVQIIQPSQVPLQGLYATLGLDRSLALWGAGALYGYPVLVVDAGTALTLTGANERLQFAGGAILPGLGLQLRSLADQTAALPSLALPDPLPPRWAKTTVEAIQSGVVYTAIAGLHQFFQDWWHHYPTSQVVLTGGDAERLFSYLQSEPDGIDPRLRLDTTVLFQGIAALRRHLAGRG